MTSPLRETLRRVALRATGKNIAEQFTSAVSESRNLVVLFATVEASCFAVNCPFFGVSYKVLLHKTCHAVFEKIAGQVA